jgi:hypothetical protein
MGAVYHIEKQNGAENGAIHARCARKRFCTTCSLSAEAFRTAASDRTAAAQARTPSLIAPSPPQREHLFAIWFQVSLFFPPPHYSNRPPFHTLGIGYEKLKLLYPPQPGVVNTSVLRYDDSHCT